MGTTVFCGMTRNKSECLLGKLDMELLVPRGWPAKPAELWHASDVFEHGRTEAGIPASDLADEKEPNCGTLRALLQKRCNKLLPKVYVGVRVHELPGMEAK